MNSDDTSAAGTMVVVVGPSGAGKDSLMDYARQRLRDNDAYQFVQRCITRDSAAGGEDHQPVTIDEFEDMRRQGRFAVSWGAHELFYGIPAQSLEEVQRGRTLIANGSRIAIPEFRKVYPNLVVVSITADRAVIAKRLMARGRETAEEIERRLNRAADAWETDCEIVAIDNSTSLESAGERFVSALLAIAGVRVPETVAE
ncbi:phosphonate metabolism protein/1,5-bisphosphokinase (PRPP-forming) PhnN [Rhizobium sp. KVB221]|uniref:Ribose 1,5-bisphosphate phosphokinase PhnN n=1 Tax=Rhizobium setariae TaxID=2801340 RepID=A0A936YM55_9HYPH|nr:phosphonate metabolism protein/1,5-bisphosphokinase (PRPP-forming) PhnN [Rhizobium setariae]MBL0372928.1 phosphonate metabolism protein/1,5-bisphosphokinase (PRPP-forming) PhnN [Rhizobium setariae]